MGPSEAAGFASPAPRPGLAARVRALTADAAESFSAPPIRIAPDACFNTCRPDLACDLCAAACPVAALERDLDPQAPDITVAASCLGCGQCAVACPTGAITADGFGLRPVPEGSAVEAAAIIPVECRRVPDPVMLPGAARVPCLAGLSATDLLSAMAEGGVPVLLDRGLCGSCALAGVDRPWAESLAAARALAAGCGVPDTDLPRAEMRPLPGGFAPQPLRLAATTLTRRALFARLARNPTPPVRRGGLPRPASRARRLAVPDRIRRLQAIERIAVRWNGRVAPGLFPAIAVSDACRHHAICAPLCPTGALALYQDRNVAGLRFDSNLCIVCGECQRGCPEQALELHRQGNGRRPQTPVDLTRHEQAACRACGVLFVAPGGETRCPACGKNSDLMREGFALFQRARGGLDIGSG